MTPGGILCRTLICVSMIPYSTWMTKVAFWGSGGGEFYFKNLWIHQPWLLLDYGFPPRPLLTVFSGWHTSQYNSCDIEKKDCLQPFSTYTTRSPPLWLQMSPFFLLYKISRNKLSQVFYSQPNFSCYVRMRLYFSKGQKKKITHHYSRPFW